MDRLRHLDWIPVAGDMHVHDARRLPHQVVVESRFEDAALLKLRHHGLNLILSENQVAHHHRSAAVPLESYPRTQSQSSFNFYAVEYDMQILSRHAKPNNVARLQLPWTAHCILDFFPVAGRCIRSGARCLPNRQGAANQESYH